MNGIDRLDKTALREEASRLHLQGNLPAATAAFEQLLSVDATNTAALIYLGGTAYQQGRLEEAETHLHEAVRLEPDSPEANNNYGLVLRARGDLLGAIGRYRRAIEVQPGFIAAHKNLAVVLRQAGRWDEAITAHEKLLELAPALEEHRASLAAMLHDKALQAAKAGDVGTARAFVRRALAHAPQRGEYVNTILATATPGENLLEAIDAAAEAWRLLPGEENARHLWEACNRVGDDVAACRAAVAAQPQNPFRRIAMGNALRRKNFGHAAEHAYRAAIELSPDLSFGYQRLAFLLLSIGRTREADRMLQRAASIRPGREVAMRFDAAFLAQLPAAGPVAAKTLRPTPNDDGRLLVFAACDGVYFGRFASAWLHSVTKNAGVPVNFHLHIVNPPADIEQRIDGWNKVLGNPGIGLTVEYADASGWTDEFRKTFYACARFRVLPGLMSLRRPILMLDTDLLVLGDLNRFLDAVSEGDVAAVSVDQQMQEAWNWYWADVVYAAPTEVARTYFADVARYIEHFLTPDKARWFLDQIALSVFLSVDNAEGRRPRLVRIARDVHRLELRYADGQDLPPDETVLFWSAHASTIGVAQTLETQRYQNYVLPWPIP